MKELENQISKCKMQNAKLQIKIQKEPRLPAAGREVTLI